MWYAFQNEAGDQRNNNDSDSLRDRLRDYYGTAMQQFPMAAMDLGRIDQMSDEEVFREARKAGLV